MGDPRAKLLVDSPAVWTSVQADLAAARDYAYFQTYSFEGDWVGTALAEALIAANAPDRRLLVDSYTRINQSDRWIHSPATLFDPGFRAELRATTRLVDEMRSAGVGVRFGRPLGLLAHRVFRRDHKKLILFDDRVAYVGGINFAEHNFEWHDLMVRIEHPEVARFLGLDFRRSWEGRSEVASREFPDMDMDLLLMPGPGNREAFRGLLELIDGARHRIWVIGPYVTPPFTQHLASATERGVGVRVITPRHNNMGYFQRFLLAEASRGKFEVQLYEDRMIHMKCMLIDNDTLVIGSSNFDTLGYYGFFSEVVAVFRSPRLIRAFRVQVLEPDLAASTPFDGSDRSGSDKLGDTIATLANWASTKLARALAPSTRR